jgi:hypothetical protein
VKKMIFWVVLKLEITYKSYNILKDFGFFQTIFLKITFLHGEKYLGFHNSSFLH